MNRFSRDAVVDAIERTFLRPADQVLRRVARTPAMLAMLDSLDSEELVARKGLVIEREGIFPRMAKRLDAAAKNKAKAASDKASAEEALRKCSDADLAATQELVAAGYGFQVAMDTNEMELRKTAPRVTTALIEKADELAPLARAKFAVTPGSNWDEDAHSWRVFTASNAPLIAEISAEISAVREEAASMQMRAVPAQEVKAWALAQAARLTKAVTPLEIPVEWGGSFEALFGTIGAGVEASA